MAFGTLERSKSSQPMSDINVTPLVDVMLVLLVIFIITAPLMVSSIKLDLPKTDAAEQSDEPSFVSISIDKSQTLFYNDKPTTLAALKGTLEKRARENPDTEVQLNADTNVPYGKVVEIMGLAQKSGLKRIGFVADPDAAPIVNKETGLESTEAAVAEPVTAPLKTPLTAP